MTARRLRAPATDGGLLVDPPPGAVAGQIAANAAQLEPDGTTIFREGRRAGCEPQVRREVLAAAGGFLRRHGLDGRPFDLDAVSSLASVRWS